MKNVAGYHPGPVTPSTSARDPLETYLDWIRERPVKNIYSAGLDRSSYSGHWHRIRNAYGSISVMSELRFFSPCSNSFFYRFYSLLRFYTKDWSTKILLDRTKWKQCQTSLVEFLFFCFCCIPKPRTYIQISEHSVRRQMAWLGFFLPPMPRRVSNPRQLVELHQTGTFEGGSTNWATAPQQNF